ncbi:hypothetical protein [Streptomyces lydicus]|uniref:hypothetical protein n=1 Tax=Streptomyces lydicus TaxID=47763 RepID=UPI0037B0FAB5
MPKSIYGKRSTTSEPHPLPDNRSRLDTASGPPLTWGGFVALLLVITGGAVVLIALLVAYGARASFRAPRERPLTPLLATTGALVLTGAGIAALGLRLH